MQTQNKWALDTLSFSFDCLLSLPILTSCLSLNNERKLLKEEGIWNSIPSILAFSHVTFLTLLLQISTFQSTMLPIWSRPYHLLKKVDWFTNYCERKIWSERVTNIFTMYNLAIKCSPIGIGHRWPLPCP